MPLLLIPLLFFIWRSLDFLIIFFSQKVIPYLGFFPYANQLPLYHLPNWLSALANFDGLHYLAIAKNGYGQYEQAFFPLYPLLIKFLSPLFSNNQLLTGLIISNVSFLIGITILARSYKDSKWLIIFLLCFPTSFFFGAVYTEGLFFLLVVSTLFFLKKQNYLLVAIFAFLTATTRIVGVFIIVPIVFHIIQRMDPRKAIYNHLQPFITMLAPLLGLGIYCFYLWKTTGDPFFFFTSQPAFGASRSTHLISFFQVYYRYLKIFFTAAHNFQYFVSILECSFFSFILIILILDLLKNLKIRNYDLLGLNIFSLINILLPTLTGTFLSIPRFSLMSLSVFIYLSQIKSNLIRYLILIIFVVLHVILLGLFTQGYFIS